MKLSITQALKEWAIAVDALEQGKTIMLLRKGGIQEEGGRFKVANNHILLYPTYEHQQPFLLTPDYACQVNPVPSGWHPEIVRIGSWAEITHILPVRNDTVIKELSQFHIWNEQFVSDRLKWKQQQPLYVLLLRTHRLAQTQLISYHSEYGGCKSWIHLTEPILITDYEPVLDNTAYSHLVDQICAIIGNKPLEVADA